MYLTETKTALRKAIIETFDEDYPREEWRAVHASLEYPSTAQDYPGIWIDFEPTGQFEIVQVGGGQQYTVDATDPAHPIFHTFTTWHFQGVAQFTVVALAPLEHARLFDELAKVMAFGRENPATSTFRSIIEQNDFVAMNIDFDQIGVGGFDATPGTPWGTEDTIWEGTLSMEVKGEFNSDGVTGDLVPLRAITIYPLAPGDTPPSGDWPSQ